MSLENWFTEHGITYDKSLLQINYNPFSVIAAADLQQEMVVCRIPKDAILSIRTCAIADLLEAEEIGGILGLAIAILYELSLGEKSPWFTYLNSLPPKELIPLFWPQKRVELLEGTDIGNGLEKERELFREDYTEIVVPIIEKHGFDKEFMSFERFMQVTFWATSRAFEVDSYHGESMVPFADLFNHKTNGEHVHFTSEADVCELCGAVSGCDCLHDEEGEWEDDEMDEDVPQLQDATDEDAPQLETVEEVSAHLDGATIVESSQEDPMNSDMMEMIVVKPCAKGEEVFNTYGKHSNSALMNRYGFIEPKNPFSFVSVQRDAVIDCLPEEVTQQESFSDKLAFWSELGLVIVDSLEDEDEEEGTQHLDHVHKDGCCSADHEHEHEHDHDHEHGDDDGIEQDDIGEDYAEEYDQDMHEQPSDDFAIEADGKPNFRLYAFLTLIFMQDEQLEMLIADIDSLFAALNELKKTGYQGVSKSSKGKGKSSVSPLNAVMAAIARSRLALYPRSIQQDQELLAKTTEEQSRYAIMLSIEEKEILAKCISISE